MAKEITTLQELNPVINGFTDCQSRPAEPVSPPVWSTDNTDLLTLTPAGDGMSCNIKPTGMAGVACVQVKADILPAKPMAKGKAAKELPAAPKPAHHMSAAATKAKAKADKADAKAAADAADEAAENAEPVVEPCPECVCRTFTVHIVLPPAPVLDASAPPRACEPEIDLEIGEAIDPDAEVNADAQEHTVNILNMRFSPAFLTIPAGDSVLFVNNDTLVHTVTDDAGGIASGDIQPGKSWTRTYPVAGEYAFHCEKHPAMKGTITVV